jgi:hypothetical protein
MTSGSESVSRLLRSRSLSARLTFIYALQPPVTPFSLVSTAKLLV